MILNEGGIDIRLFLTDTIQVELEKKYPVRIFCTALGKRWFAMHGENSTPKFCFEGKGPGAAAELARQGLSSWERTKRKPAVIS